CSSRRRHTRSYGDWSSDVCSSDLVFSVARTCPQCRGAGKIVTKPCSTCKGAGRVTKERKITVKIPAGIASGQQLRLQAEGEAGELGRAACRGRGGSAGGAGGG